MLPDLLGAAAVVIVAACPIAARRLRPGRRARPRTAGVPGPGTPAAPRRPEAQPRGEATGPSGYDSGVITGPPEGGGS